MIRQRRHPWPIPNSTPTDRARSISRSLLAALQQSEAEVVRLRAVAGEEGPAPTAAQQHIDTARRFGELWLAPDLDTTTGARLTVEQAAALVGKQPATIRQWISRGTRHGHLIRHPDGIDEGELLDLAAALAGTPPTEEGTRAA